MINLSPLEEPGLFTPVLVHAKDGLWMHLIFNMLNLMSLGSMIEDRQGTGRLGWLVLLIAILSNLCQFWWSGPQFYGMSGVVYGLMAYVWIKEKRDPTSGLFLHPQTFMMGMVWFVLCLVGAVPGIAADVVNEAGISVRGEVGDLVVRKPWIGMTRGFWNDRDRYTQTYWSRFPDVWVHGDWAAIDDDGLWYILGRSDDTIKIAGKRLGPAEVESVLVGHPPSPLRLREMSVDN